ncbi:hypothetical protein Tco_0650660 [Tanacetum coccineum]
MSSFIRTGNLVGESDANLVGGTCSTLTSLFHNTSQPAYLEGADTRREEKGQCPKPSANSLKSIQAEGLNWSNPLMSQPTKDTSSDGLLPDGFGSIAGGLDHVNHAIRLPLEHGNSRLLGKVDHPNPSVGTNQFFAQPPNVPNTPVDKKDSDFDEILDDLFRVGAENMRRIGQEKIQNGCNVDTLRDTNHESDNLLNFPISATNELSSICKQDVDLEKEEAEVEDDDDGDTYDI